jgi:hypothetical protein
MINFAQSNLSLVNAAAKLTSGKQHIGEGKIG